MKRRELVTTLVEAVGAGMVIGGVAQIYTPAGWIASGAWLLLVSWLVAR